MLRRIAPATNATLLRALTPRACTPRRALSVQSNASVNANASARVSAWQITSPTPAPRQQRPAETIAPIPAPSSPRVVVDHSRQTCARVDSPYTGLIVAEEPYLSAEQVTRLVAEAAAAQKEWAQVPLSGRIVAVGRLVAALTADCDAIAGDISRHMGKPLVQARAEVAGMAVRARAFADLAPTALASVIVEDALSARGLLPPSPAAAANGGVARLAVQDAAQSTSAALFERAVTRQPLGVVAAATPWNYPLLTTANATLPALLAGNAVLLKPSPRTPTAGRWWARAAAAAGLPRGLVASAFCQPAVFESAVLASPAVAHVTLTGSVDAGRAVYSAAAAASGTATAPRFLRVALELGGNDALYVADDADVGAAAAAAADGAGYNAGQSCCAVQRVFVHEAVYGAFLERAVAELAALRLGDPLSEGTTMGPLALASARPRLEGMIADAQQRGARVVLGGGPHASGGPGAARARFFEPTVLSYCPPDAAVMRDEAFGPLLAVWPVRGDDDAVRLTNASQFGLTASVWTQDPARAQRLAAQLNVGTVFANRCDYVDPYLHWGGGWGLSGLGSSVGVEGFHAFTRVRATHFKFPV